MYIIIYIYVYIYISDISLRMLKKKGIDHNDGTDMFVFAVFCFFGARI